MGKNDAFIEKIHNEMLQLQRLRMRYDTLKITFVIALLGFGSIKVRDFALLQYSLYLAPLVALLFDIMSMGHTFAIRRDGMFLRDHSPSKLERKFEKFVGRNRDTFFKLASFIFNLLAFPAAILLIKAVTDSYPTKYGWFVLGLLFALHITMFVGGGMKIKRLDSPK